MAGTKGNSGRPRKPTQLKILQGTYQKCRANPNELKPKTGKPKASKGLNTRVRKKYDELGYILTKMGILSEFDGPAMEILAVSLVEYEIASDWLINNSSNLRDKDKDGKFLSVYKFYVAWADGAFKRASSMLAKFGLTPADRSRVDVINLAKTKENKWSEFHIDD